MSGRTRFDLSRLLWPRCGSGPCYRLIASWWLAASCGANGAGHSASKTHPWEPLSMLAAACGHRGWLQLLPALLLLLLLHLQVGSTSRTKTPMLAQCRKGQSCAVLQLDVAGLRSGGAPDLLWDCTILVHVRHFKVVLLSASSSL
jgi:hypothetical protein